MNEETKNCKKNKERKTPSIHTKLFCSIVHLKPYDENLFHIAVVLDLFYFNSAIVQEIRKNIESYFRPIIIKLPV